MHPAALLRALPVRAAAALIALIAAGLITYFSLVPPSEVPGKGLPDKLLHFMAYAGLAAILTVALGVRRVVMSTVLAAGLGAGLEVAQGLQGAGRQAEIADALANLAGAMLGAALAWRILPRPKA